MLAFLIDAGCRAWLLTPYEADFIEALKADIPWRYREWDKEAKAWLVRAPYVERAARVADEWFDLMRAQTEGAAPPVLTRLAQQYPAHATLEVWPTASQDVIRAAYRALVQRHHPDHNQGAGDARTKALNLAYEALGLRSN